MSEFEGALLTLGVIIMGSGLPLALRPHRQFKKSRRNRDARLAELDAGAPETYFEERRELEAYTPRFNPSNRALRSIGVAMIVLGTIAIFWRVFQ